MTYQELFDEVKKLVKDADVSSVKEHVAFQFNVLGEGAGIFYAEVKEGELFVEPYDYVDHDVMFEATGEVFMKILNGKLDPILAYTTGKIKIHGPHNKALLIKELIKKPKKATAKKATSTTKKTAATTKKAAATTKKAATAKATPEKKAATTVKK